jgi:lysophospholipase L1-like esterase
MAPDLACYTGERKGMRQTIRSRMVAVLAILCVTQVSMTNAGATAGAPTSNIEYYVSVGDSYAAGNQPTAAAWDHKDTNGFAYQVVKLARARGYHLDLLNFGCGGSTTTSVLQQVGCSVDNPGPDATSYPTQTQGAAASRFISRHRGHNGLVTVSIGGNDILACEVAAQLLSCARNVLKVVKHNLTVLLAELRHAAGPSVPIVGLTYPDIFLGMYVSPPVQKSLAILSVTEFRNLVNPTLKAAYSAAGAHFVEVTKATGAYTPFSETTSYGSYGMIPVAVADVCNFTYYCQVQDVHPTTLGYTVIARLIVGTLPKDS